MSESVSVFLNLVLFFGVFFLMVWIGGFTDRRTKSPHGRDETDTRRAA